MIGAAIRRWGALTLLPAALLLNGCRLVGGPAARAASPAAAPGTEGSGWTETGIASWYGRPYHGRPTASGETYDMDARTGAHRTLPFGTRIRVENLENGRSATLTINDRGPFVEGRILDVSRRVARELDMELAGTARVRITVLDGPAEVRTCWMVQVGAFSREDSAAQLRDRIAGEGLPARVAPSLDGLFRIWVGPFTDVDEARRVSGRHGGFLVGC